MRCTRLLLFSPVSARIFNVSIDDTLGDERTGQKPFYSSGWYPRSVAGPECLNCIARPDPTLVFGGTWHDRSVGVTYGPATVSLSFNGTKIYAFCILFNDIGTRSNSTRLSFYLDGALNSTKDFLHTSNPAEDHYLYNQLVYESEPVAAGPHSLVISNWADNQTGSLVLFDYAVYVTSTEGDPVAIPDPKGTAPVGSSNPVQTSKATFNTGFVATEDETDDEDDAQETSVNSRRSKSFFPRSLALLFGGAAKRPANPAAQTAGSTADKPRSTRWLKEQLYMELLAAEWDGEEPDDGALEGSGDEYGE
ncbi:hypothetical protein AURDEDRAFT_175141 [Auricularia subglabra TFB-10046 SS5]|nr:hypothetical protein AURDEDRAFT_175141 [Auricularia subglabra TFB-10046 SS5]